MTRAKTHPHDATEPLRDAEEGLKAVAALRKGQHLAVEAGLDKMTMEEIDAEIRAVRVARRQRQVSQLPKAIQVATSPYDAAEHLRTEEEREALMEAAIEDGHPQIIASAQDAIERSRKMYPPSTKPE